MKPMVGILIEVPTDFQDVILVVYNDAESAKKDFTKIKNNPKYSSSKLDDTVIIPDLNLPDGYYWYVHEPILVTIPDNIKCNCMRLNLRFAKELLRDSEYNRIDSKWLRRYLSDGWVNNPIGTIITHVQCV